MPDPQEVLSLHGCTLDFHENHHLKTAHTCTFPFKHPGVQFTDILISFISNDGTLRN